MSSPLIFPLPGQESFAKGLSAQLGATLGKTTMRRFPDGETYVRVEEECQGREAIIVCSLDRPDLKVLPLFFLADTLRDLGATRVGLVAPYLAYMRQDVRFEPGEGITSRYFAKMASRHVDWLVTVDPHLHRYDSLDEIYGIPSQVVHAAPLVSAWIGESVDKPLLIGPDVESEQWVADVAQQAGAPSVVLEKVRHGDHDVEVSVPKIDSIASGDHPSASQTTLGTSPQGEDYTPVLFDDIISTGHTMIETIRHLRDSGMKPPVVVGVHGIFADDAEKRLIAAGAERIVTTNTIPHCTNAIDLTAPVAEAVRSFGRSK